jgi:hypothetical protein
VLPTNEKENPMTTTTSLTPHTNELQEISGLPTESALRSAAPFLTRLVEDPAFVESEILPLLQEVQRAKEWYVARRYDGEGGAYSLKVFVWPPGTGTEIHDHSSWGAYLCAWGSVVRAEAPHRLTVNEISRDAGPVFSLDGTKIALQTNRDGNAEIYEMRTDGTEPVNLTNDPAGDFTPDWQPVKGRF